MKELFVGIILYPHLCVGFAACQVAKMLFQVLFKGFYDLRAAVPFVNRVIILEEIFFDLQ